jgi:hypothetical protein
LEKKKKQNSGSLLGAVGTVAWSFERFHQRLTEAYGIPMWLTLTVSLVGMIIVTVLLLVGVEMCLGTLFPGNPPPKKPSKEGKKESKESSKQEPAAGESKKKRKTPKATKQH